MTDVVERFMTLFEQIRVANSKQYTEAEVRLIIEGTLAEERERIANQIDRMPFGDTAASFAVWIRAGAP